jgi:hypothetical protein
MDAACSGPGSRSPWAPQRRSLRSLPAAARFTAVRIEPCASTEYTASIGGAPPEAPGPDRLTLVLVGDTGFNPKGAGVAPEGFVKDGKALGFKESLSGVARDVDGDLAFVNLETVVTDRNEHP